MSQKASNLESVLVIVGSTIISWEVIYLLARNLMHLLH